MYEIEYQAIAKNCSKQKRMVSPFLCHQNAEQSVRTLKQTNKYSIGLKSEHIKPNAIQLSKVLMFQFWMDRILNFRNHGYNYLLERTIWKWNKQNGG